MRRGVAIVLVLGVGVAAAAAACKGKRRAARHDAAPEVAAEADDAEADDAEVIDVFEAAELTIALERSSQPIVTDAYIDLRNWVTELTLVVTSTAADPIDASLPGFVFAHLPDYAYPYGDEGCLPPVQFVVAVPDDQITVPAGEAVRLRVEHAWYLGNAHRPAPARAGGPASFELEAAPDDDPRVRLAEAVRDTPELAGLAFAVAGGCTAEPWLTDATLAHTPVHRIAAVERVLRDVGIEPRSPVFEAARTRRAETLAKLTEDLTTFEHQRSLEGLAVLYAASDPAFAKAYAGDAEVAALVARYLQPDASGARPVIIVALLERLGVATPAVLGALDYTAAEDLDPATRERAAAARATLAATP